MNKSVKKVLLFGTVGFVSASSAISLKPSAEEGNVPEDIITPGGDEGGDVTETPTVTPTETATPDPGDGGDGTETPQPTDAPTDPTNTPTEIPTPDPGDGGGDEIDEIVLSDIGASTVISGTTYQNGEVLYTNGAKLRVAVVCLRDDIELVGASIGVSGGEVLLDVSPGDSVFDMPDFEGDLVIEYEFSDGTLLSQPMSDICESLYGIVKVQSDNTMPEIQNVEFDGNKVQVGDKYYYSSDGNIQITAIDEQSGVNYDTWEVIGVKGIGDKITVGDDGVLMIPSSELPDGTHELTIRVADNCGNSSSSSIIVNLLREAPKIKGKAHSKVSLVDGVAYSSSDIKVELSGADDDKISKIELLRGESVIGVVDEGTFSISSSGEYSVRVTDIAGNVDNYRLEDLFSDMCSNIVIDSIKPSIEVKMDGSDVDYANWITVGKDLKVDVSDNVGIARVEVAVNGSKFIREFDTKEASISIDLKEDVPRSSNGEYNISVSATDTVGNESTVSSIVVRADYDPPSLDGITIPKHYLKNGSSLYMNSPLVVGGSCSDIGSGVDRVELIKDGSVVADDLPFSINVSGEYSIRVTDKAGLSSEKTIAEILNEDTNMIVIDETKPILTRVSGFVPDLTVGGVKWFKSHPVFVYRVDDDNLDDVSIKVNGVEKVTGISDDTLYTVDTTGVEGGATVVVHVRDKAGNEVSDTFEYSVDVDAPINVAATVNKSSNFKAGKVFFKETPSIDVSASDPGVGVDRYILSGSKSESNASGKFTLGDGRYFVEVRDKLGNSTEVIDIASLLGYKSNDLVVDGVSPVIHTERPKGDVGGWFAKDVTYNINLSDNIGIDRASVKINGTEVDSFTTTSADQKTGKLSADTSKVKSLDNGMYVVEVEVYDNAGNSSKWSDSIFIDREAPVVKEFIFNGNGYQEGVNINGTDRYGFFFDGPATCQINVADGTISSGMRNLYVSLESTSGSVKEETVAITGGSATIQIPDNFKGFVVARADDNVGNTSKEARPDGVVTENSNCHINNVSIDIVLPETQYTDQSGIALYNKDVDVNANIGCAMSGLRRIEWGIGDENAGNVVIDSNGNISGDSALVKSSEKNILLNMGLGLKSTGNVNGIKLWVRATDRTGHVSETSKAISIDKDAPVISVTYNKTEGSTYYSSDRSATISVKERNFDPSLFTVEGSAGTLGSWSNNGDIWTNTMSFSEEKEYKFTLNCTDRAGNKAEAYSSESFTVDKTNPKLTVSWEAGEKGEGDFYKSSRKAVLTVVERNFDPDLFSVTGEGSLSAWSGSGDTHTATLSFDRDGEYEFSVSGKDKAGNECEAYKSGKFIIDATAPELKISGVENSVSYKKDVSLIVKMSDKSINKDKSYVKMSGRKSGDVKLDGSINSTLGEYKLSDIPKVEANDDVYTLEAVVEDMAGNVSSEKIVFSVNRFGSKYSFLDASILGNYINSAKDVVVHEENVDRLNTDKARVAIICDGEEISVDKKLISIKEEGGEDDKYEYTYTVKKDAFKKDGKYLVQIYSQAEEGTDYSSVSQEYAFVLDSTKPEIIISGVEDNEKYRDYSRTVTVDVRDMSGVKDIEVYLNSKKVSLSKRNGVYSFRVNESESPQMIEARVTDMAGNESEGYVRDFVITSNAVAFIVNQAWFKAGIAMAAVFLAGIIALIAKSRKDSKKAEEELLQEHGELYRSSSVPSASSSMTSGVTTSEKDMVQDLETGDHIGVSDDYDIDEGGTDE